jgi:hypothetical protein
MRKLFLHSLLFVATLGVHAVEGGDFRLYQIGNSHTFDSLPRNGLPDLFASTGTDLTNGWHIRCARPLSYISSNPDDTCVDPNEFGTWIPALTESRWDAITLQSHTGANGLAEIQAVKTIVSALPNQFSTRVLLYVNWPSIEGSEFKTTWESRYGSESQAVIQNYRYFVWLFKQMQEADLGNHSVDYVPIGEVLYELDSRFRLGEYPPFTQAGDLYRDNLHLNNVGRYIAGLTLLAVLMDYDVRQLGLPPARYNEATLNFHAIDLLLADYLQEVVWSVVQRDPFGPRSVPMETQITPMGDGIHFSVESYLGYEYMVLDSVDLENWAVRQFPTEGNGGQMEFVDEVPVKFYKLIRF